MYPHRGRWRGRGLYRNTHAHQQTSRQAPAEMETTSGSISFVHDNKCCKGIDLNLDLNADSTTFLNHLKNMWNMFRKSPPVVSKLHQFLNQCANPYVEVLKLVYNCQEFNNAKIKTLPFFIIEEFKIWSMPCKNGISHLLTPHLKINAFKVISQQNSQSLTKLVVEVYEMACDGAIFLGIIKCMIEKKKFKEACHCAILLNLQDRFSVDDFLLPMILQDKISGIDEFLAISPRHQNELIVLLDSFLGKPSVREAMATYALKLKVPDVKGDKLHAKPLKKLITRLVKTFKIRDSLIPNLNKRRNEGALQFLLHKRYTENSFGEESWREMVQEAVGEDKELHKELVVQVYLYGDSGDALRWAKFYNVDKEHWPWALKEGNSGGEEPSQSEENWDDIEVQNPEHVPVIYHKFPLEFNAIILIDTETKFKHFLDVKIKKIEMVGIDCEWKPNFGTQRNELALMQIATRKNVFILDIISLGSKVSHLWQELGKFLFHNSNILKLGFGFISDITMIKQTLPELNMSQRQVGFLDLLSLWKHLDKYPNVSLPYEVTSGGQSFSTLVNHCFGRPLDKSDQFSNWEKRPLRESQLIYASLDAYCLIQVYDIIKTCCEKAGVDFDEISYNLMANEKSSKKKAKKPPPKKKGLKTVEDIAQPPCPYFEQIPVSSLKVVCDTMLQGLGKNLRRCGIDAAILENHMDHMECVRYAQDEKRFILTRGAIFNRLYGYVPMGHCLKILSENVDDQLKEVLEYYKVNVTKEDVFSVCQACNGDSFARVGYSKMLYMKRMLQGTKEYDFDADEATGFTSDEDFEYEPSVPMTYKSVENEDKVDVELCETSRGASIQIDTIPDAIFNKIELFYVCEYCGKVYWDGSHLGRVLSGRLQGIVQ